MLPGAQDSLKTIRLEFSQRSGDGILGHLRNLSLLARFDGNQPRARVWIVFVTISLVIAIGFSRIYLGVHYFSDVVAGYCAANFWLALSITGNEVATRDRELKRLARHRNGETV